MAASHGSAPWLGHECATHTYAQRREPLFNKKKRTNEKGVSSASSLCDVSFYVSPCLCLARLSQLHAGCNRHPTSVMNHVESSILISWALRPHQAASKMLPCVPIVQLADQTPNKASLQTFGTPVQHVERTLVVVVVVVVVVYASTRPR